jgi:hypothetical protein
MILAGIPAQSVIGAYKSVQCSDQLSLCVLVLFHNCISNYKSRFFLHHRMAEKNVMTDGDSYMEQVYWDLHINKRIPWYIFDANGISGGRVKKRGNIVSDPELDNHIDGLSGEVGGSQPEHGPPWSSIPNPSVHGAIIEKIPPCSVLA